jgi:hypothetical protein
MIPWLEFRAWLQLRSERVLERENNSKRQTAGLPPVKRGRTPAHGPQEAPE